MSPQHLLRHSFARRLRSDGSSSRLALPFLTRALVATSLALLSAKLPSAAAQTSPPTAIQPAPTTETSQPLNWHLAYQTARDAAIEKRKTLWVVFHRENPEQLERWTSEIARLMPLSSQLATQTCALLSIEDPHEQQAASEGAANSPKAERLIDHPSFAELRGVPGIAIIDFQDPVSPRFRQVISIVPYNFGMPPQALRYSTLPPASLLETLADLPDGSLTERTLVLALRTHPDLPKSASGSPHPLLRREATRHSQLQAQLGRQGHHHWDRRFAEINSRLPDHVVAQEVCAESWSGQGLIAAAQECVRSWRQSSGHWNAVSARHYSYGFDMHRGENGTWYATGIFARYR